MSLPRLTPLHFPPWWGALRDRLDRLRTRWRDRGDLTVTTRIREGQDSRRFLDPETLARFGLTPLMARRVVEGYISGLHRSPFRGFSVEFADHREYVPGDDLKFLDWMLYARTDHYYIKRSEEETNVRCFILLDRSASMAFGTGRLTKWDYACQMTACLSYLMIKQQDAVALGLFSDTPTVLIPPRGRNQHLHTLLRTLIQYPPSGPSKVGESMRILLQRIKRRSLVVVISDLQDDPEETLRGIRLIASHNHDVLVFQVQDPAEIDFHFTASARFRDVETGEELEVDPATIRETYQAQIRALTDFYRRGLSEAGIDYQPVNIRDPHDRTLEAYLHRRMKLR
jgi:uncharacterized protein (DUF58 family)